MILLPLRKQIYTEGGYMLNNILYGLFVNPIVWIVVFWVVALIVSEIYHRRRYGK